GLTEDGRHLRKEEFLAATHRVEERAADICERRERIQASASKVSRVARDSAKSGPSGSTIVPAIARASRSAPSMLISGSAFAISILSDKTPLQGSATSH